MAHPHPSSFSHPSHRNYPSFNRGHGRKNPIDELPFLSREGRKLSDAVAHSLGSQSGSDRAFMRSFVADRLKEIYESHRSNTADEKGDAILAPHLIWESLSALLIFNPEKIRIDLDRNGLPHIIECHECGATEIAFVRIHRNREYGQYTVIGRPRIVGFCSRCIRNNKKYAKISREKGKQATSLCFFSRAKATRRKKRVESSLRKGPARKPRGFVRSNHLATGRAH